MKNLKSIIALFVLTVFSVNVWGSTFTKVTTTPSDWSGEYLLVYETSTTSGLSWNGLDAGKNGVSQKISDGTITATNPITIIVAKLTIDGYCIQVKGGTNNGSYISTSTNGTPSYSNGLKFVTTQDRIDLEMDESGAVQIYQSPTSGNMYLLYNKNSGDSNERFRFYKNTNLGGANYSTPYLYLKEPDCTAPTTPLSISASSTPIALNKTADISTTGGNGGAITYEVTPSTGKVENGVFSATAEGTYKVTAHQDQTDGGVCAQDADVTITVGPIQFGDYVTQCCTPWTPTLSYAKTTMQVGEEQDAVVGTTHGTATYTSNNPSSVEVNESTGHIKAVGGGTATISVTWAGDETYCEQSTSSQEITVNGSLQVTFNGNGADGGTEMEAQMVEYNVATNINKNTYTKTGYTFQGWAETSEATSIKYTDEQSVTFTAGVELFAVWRINAHVVTVQDAIGGTIAIEPKTTTIDYGTTVTATATLATGYNFVTWSATPEVTFAEATNKNTTFPMPDYDVLLTAEYTPILVTKIDLKKGSEVVTALEFEKNVTPSVTLTTAFTPADALDKTVEWHSGNTDVVTVNNGEIGPVGLGTATVTATSMVVPSVYGSVTVTVYEWQDADPKYTLTNQPASTVYYETNKINFSNWTIEHNFKRSDDATKIKQEDVASSNWTVTLGGEVIANNYTLTTADNSKALVIKVGETTLYNQTLTVNEKAKHTYIDRVHENETKVMIDTYTIPSLTNTTAKTEGTCEETHYVFKGWVAEANADAPNDDNLIAAGGSTTAEADAIFYAVWAERKNVTEDRTMSYGWESTDSKTGWTISSNGTNSNYKHSGAKSGEFTQSTSTNPIWVNCIQTSSVIAKPKHIQCYYSKSSGNTNSNSYWAIETKPNSGSWTEVAAGKTFNKVTEGTFELLEADLTAYTNVIVAVNVKTTQADRIIDDVVLTYEVTEPKDIDYITECVTRYELSFDANGGTGTAPATILLKEGGKVALPNATLTKAYNTFSGWNDGSKTTAAGAEYTMPGHDVNMKAQWTACKVTDLTITTPATATEFGVGQAFSSEGLKVKATYESTEVETDVTFTTNLDGHVFTEGEVGQQTVTISYKEGTTTYNVEVKAYPKAEFYVFGEYYDTYVCKEEAVKLIFPAIPASNHVVYKNFVGWSATEFDATTTEPTTLVAEGAAFADGDKFYAVFGRASDYEEKTTSIGLGEFSEVSGSYAWCAWTKDNLSGYGEVSKNQSEELQLNADKNTKVAAIYNTTALPGSLKSIKVTKKSGSNRNWIVYVDNIPFGQSVPAIEETDNRFLGQKIVTDAGATWTVETGDYRFFSARNTETGASVITTLDITYMSPIIYSWTTNWVAPDHVRTGLTYDNAGTICLPYAVKADDYKGASVWSIESRVGSGDMIYAITLVQEVDEGGNKNDLVAGKPYIFFAEESEFQLFYSGDEYTGSTSVWANGLIGNLNIDNIVINEGGYAPGSYLINQNKLMECGKNCQVPQYRAYVQANLIGAGEPVQAPMMAPRRVIGDPNVAPTNLNGLNGSDKAVKFLKNSDIYILRNAKLYNAQGQLVK